MNLYISDLHFGHKNVIRHDNRPFSSIEEMDGTLILLWNGRVQEDDDVYIPGDFAYKNEKAEEWYLRQLKGRKHLIVGNHDAKLLRNAAAMQYFESVEKMMHVADDIHHICLCHFPICDWNGRHKGHLHIYGHIHNRTDETYRFPEKEALGFAAQGRMKNRARRESTFYRRLPEPAFGRLQDTKGASCGGF